MQTIHDALVDQAFIDTDSPPTLEPGDIHLWLWHLNDGLAQRQLTRLARLKLVDLLKIYADTEIVPDFEYGKHGKPHVAVPGFPHFNVSHGGDCVAFAFSRDQELGVDVERGSTRRRHSTLELANRFFAADEATALGALTEAQRERAFLHLWTCKEAVLKALGHGLSFGLDRLRFAIGSDGQTESLLSIAEEAGSPLEWQIHRFDPGSGHVGSLAWRGPERSVRTFRMNVDAPG